MEKEKYNHPTPKDKEKLAVLKRDGYACIICRTQEYLETAHVNHFAGEKPSQGHRYYKLSSPEQQLVTLCHYHHFIYDGWVRRGLRLLLEASKGDFLPLPLSREGGLDPQFREKLLRLVEDRQAECLRLRQAVSVYIQALQLWPAELNRRLSLAQQAFNL